MEHLQDNSLVDSKLGNDVREKKMSVVFGSWVYTLFGKKTRPSEGHETSQLGPLSFVVGVVDVRGSVFHQQRGELK